VLIVDSQVHIWENAALNSQHRQVSSYSKDDLLREMDAAGVSAAIICPPASLFDVNELAVEAHIQHPTRLGVMGWFPLDNEKARDRVAEWMERPGMLGLRWALNRPDQKSWFKDHTLDWLWPVAEKRQIPLSFLVNENMREFGEIARNHPGLKLMIDHIGRISLTKDEASFRSLSEMIALARYDNVAVKLSSAPNYSTDRYPWKNIHGYLRNIVDAFGPERCFWGTDITRLQASLPQAITMFTEELPWLKGTDLELVMGRAICKWLGWDLAVNA
jgi:predicted TIM-barrel fold metal-dependent hydrolase